MRILIVACLVFCWPLAGKAQNYNNIINYNFNSTPTHGIKIKTNLPFAPGSQMPTIIIEGYNFGSSESIGLILNYYIYSNASDFYNDASGFYFYSPLITSFGTYTPPVSLSSENGKVVIFINDKPYYQRFTVRAYAQGMAEQSAHFDGWSVHDEPESGVKAVEVPYRSKLAGTVYLPGSGIWNTDGNVGIGTITPTAKLAVNGNIRAKEIKVEAAPWPDYVFNSSYKLPDLSETEQFIKKNKHLPEVPSAAEVEKEGINLGEMNAKLLKKIEELTLYLIDLKKDNDQIKAENKNQQKEIDKLKSKL